MNGTAKAKANAKRKEEVYNLLCTGLRRAEILAYAEKKEWPETEAQIDRLIDEAITRLAEAAAISLDVETGRAIERLNKLFKEALKVQDIKTCLSVQKEINRMLQLKAKQIERSEGRSNRAGIRLV